MNDRWQPQTTVAIACTILLALWLTFCYALDGTPAVAGGFAAAMFVAFIVDVVGIVAAISGSREGNWNSRTASKVSLFLLLTPILCVGLFLLWIAFGVKRWA